MPDRLTPDICVIGGGAGGFAVAAAAARAGASTMLVDRAEPGGGPLLHAMPFQALLAAAGRARAMGDAGRFGIAPVEPQVDFRKVARHLREATAAASLDRSAARLTALGVHVLRGEARFADRRTVIAADREISARHVVLACGSVPVPPAIPGLDSMEFLTPDDFASLTRKPGRLIVVGGGPYALPLAQAYRRLGSQAVVLEAGAALGGEDPEQAAIVLAALRSEGVDIREHVRVNRVERRGKTGSRVHLLDADGAEAMVDGTHLLVLPERRPAVDTLDLDSAGIGFSSLGIEVDDDQRTTNKRVYAIGDVTGAPPSVHLAEHHAHLVARALFSRARDDTAPAAIPRVIFTSPGIASVGLGEAEARQRHGKVRVLRWPNADSDRVRAGHGGPGFVKLIADDRERILGVSVAGEDVGETIAAWALAMTGGLTVSGLAVHAPPYPSLAEIGKRAAMSYFAVAAARPGLRGIGRFLRFFG